LPARPNRPKLASGPKPYCTRNRVFLIAPLATESPRKNPFPYDALASGRGVYAYANGNPISGRDPLGLFDWPSLPQGVVNASAGIGDSALALFFLNGQSIRNALNINGGVNTCSSSYQGGQIAGIVGGFATGAGELELLNRSLASEAQLAQVLARDGLPILGAGTGTALGDAARLAAEYGGSAADWVKVTSESYTSASGLQFEIHAFQNAIIDAVVEAKTVITKW
jgi:hypothetical protein